MPDRLGNYYHRRNRDGTHDSLCTGCYMTIATVSEESHLRKIEDAHVCDPVRLFHIRESSYLLDATRPNRLWFHQFCERNRLHLNGLLGQPVEEFSA